MTQPRHNLPGNPFSTSEEEYIVYLKEQVTPDLNWDELTQRFNSQFVNTNRTKGGLQVHYSRSLKPGARRRPRRPLNHDPYATNGPPGGSAVNGSSGSASGSSSNSNSNSNSSGTMASNNTATSVGSNSVSGAMSFTNNAYANGLGSSTANTFTNEVVGAAANISPAEQLAQSAEASSATPATNVSSLATAPPPPTITAAASVSGVSASMAQSVPKVVGKHQLEDPVGPPSKRAKSMTDNLRSATDDNSTFFQQVQSIDHGRRTRGRNNISGFQNDQNGSKTSTANQNQALPGLQNQGQGTKKSKAAQTSKKRTTTTSVPNPGEVNVATTTKKRSIEEEDQTEPSKPRKRVRHTSAPDSNHVSGNELEQQSGSRPTSLATVPTQIKLNLNATGTRSKTRNLGTKAATKTTADSHNAEGVESDSQTVFVTSVRRKKAKKAKAALAALRSSRSAVEKKKKKKREIWQVCRPGFIPWEIARADGDMPKLMIWPPQGRVTVYSNRNRAFGSRAHKQGDPPEEACRGGPLMPGLAGNKYLAGFSDDDEKTAQWELLSIDEDSDEERMQIDDDDEEEEEGVGEEITEEQQESIAEFKAAIQKAGVAASGARAKGAGAGTGVERAAAGAGAVGGGEVGGEEAVAAAAPNGAASTVPSSPLSSVPSSLGAASPAPNESS